MTKILLRAGFSPLDSPQADQIILENLIWENTGNMLFPYSIMRILMREDTKITAISVNRFFSAAQAAEWSREYNCFVIPLANAFRDSFLMQLNGTDKKVDNPMYRNRCWNTNRHQRYKGNYTRI